MEFFFSETIEPSNFLIAEGVGGFLCPPNVFHEDLNKRALFFKIAPTDDDAWYYTMASLKGIKVAKVSNQEPRVSIRTSTALWNINSSNQCLVLSETFKRLFWAYDLRQNLNAEDVLTKVSCAEGILVKINWLSGIVSQSFPSYYESTSYYMFLFGGIIGGAIYGYTVGS